MRTTLIALLATRALSFVPVTPIYSPRAVRVHAELRRDEQGYIVKEDLDWPDLTVNPLSDNLGASSVKIPDACLAHVERCEPGEKENIKYLSALVLTHASLHSV